MEETILKLLEHHSSLSNLICQPCKFIPTCSDLLKQFYHIYLHWECRAPVTFQRILVILGCQGLQVRFIEGGPRQIDNSLEQIGSADEGIFEDPR